MTALDDLTVYLGTTLAGKYPDAVLVQVIEVEMSDQYARVRASYRVNGGEEWAMLAPPLQEAVLRRCARNLAMRKSPLGIQEGDLANLRIVGRDSEIRRLEAPFARLVVG